MRETHNRNRRVRPTAHLVALTAATRGCTSTPATTRVRTDRWAPSLVCFGWTYPRALWRRKLTISTCPRMAAQCNAVLSPMSSASTSSAVFDEVLDGVEVAVVRGARQRAISHQTRLLQVGALVDEEIAHGGVAVARGEEHGRVAAVVRLVERGALVYVLFDPVVVAVAAVAPDVGLVGDETPALRRSCEGARDVSAKGARGRECRARRRSVGCAVARRYVRGDEDLDRRSRDAAEARTPREVSAGHRSRITRVPRGRRA